MLKVTVHIILQTKVFVQIINRMEVCIIIMHSISICRAVDGITSRFYYMCCRDKEYRKNKQERKTDKKRLHQKASCKLNQHCLSRMYVNQYHDGSIEVQYIPAHTGHALGIDQLPALPLPKSVKNDVAHKLSKGIPTKRIIDGMI